MIYMTPPYGGVWTSIQFPQPFLTPLPPIGIIFPLFPVREDRTKGRVVRGWRPGPAPKAASTHAARQDPRTAVMRALSRLGPNA